MIPRRALQQSLGGGPGRLPSLDVTRDEFTQILQLSGGNVSQAALVSVAPAPGSRQAQPCRGDSPALRGSPPRRPRSGTSGAASPTTSWRPYRASWIIA
jgi:hypothetical protein